MAKLRSTSKASHRRKGRPPLSSEVARSHRIVTFVTAGEKAELDKLAERELTSLSTVCHRLIAAGLKK